MRKLLALLTLTFFLSSFQGCTFHTIAEEWNTRVGPDGKPVHVLSSTKIGLKLLIVLPFLGDMEITGLVNDATAKIKEEGGDNVRIIQAAQENYWYGWSPLTWIVTPVVSTVAAEFRTKPGAPVPFKE